MTLTMFLAVMLFTLLFSIGVLHIVWGFGVVWPAKNEKQLVSWVVGAKGIQAMPPFSQCLIAGTSIIVFGIIALLLGNAVPSPLSAKWVDMLGNSPSHDQRSARHAAPDRSRKRGREGPAPPR